MHERSRPCWPTLGLILLGCGPVPAEVMGSGTSGVSTGVGEGDATTMDRPSASTSGGAGSGDATGLPGTTAVDGETTQGAGPGTNDGSGTTGDGPGTTGDGTSDSASSTSAGPLPTCDELYDMASGYVLCEEYDTECHFNANTAGSDCNAMCAMFGGTCLAAFDNPNEKGEECDVIRPNTDDCDTNRGTELCVCSRSA